MNDNRPVVLVTGAAKRLGAKIVEKLAKDGYRVAIHFNGSKAEADALAESITEELGDMSAITFKADLADMSACKNLPAQVAQKFGRLDLLVNNASIFKRTPLNEIAQDQVEKFHSVHVKAPLELSLAAAKVLGAKNPPGHIVNIVDLFADYAKKDFLPYTISKAGLKSLTKNLAVELAPEILVNAIAPGAILEPAEGHTKEVKEKIIDRIPLKRFGEPADIAEAVSFLAKTKYITGQTIVIDGGRALGV